MNEVEMQERINEFLDKKKIEHPFLRECVTEFVEGHDRLFGDYVSTEDLFKRLDENLDKITFAGRNGTVMGQYEKKNKNYDTINEIQIFSNESDLEIPEDVMKSFDIFTKETKQEYVQEREDRRNNIKVTVIHELTHAAYTKNDEYGRDSFEHIFSNTSKNFMETREDKRFQGGKQEYVEGIVNYISTKIKAPTSKVEQTYTFETQAIQMLAEKVGDETIIKSAWDSNEQILTDEYIKALGKTPEEGQKSYQEFCSDMISLKIIGKNEGDLVRFFSRSKEVIGHMNNLLEGKTILSIYEINEENIKKKKEEIEQFKKRLGAKNGLEDVENSDVNKSWFDKATTYVKEKYRELKEKFMGKDDKLKDEDNER